MQPSTNNELGWDMGWSREISSGTYVLVLRFLLDSSEVAALLSTARNWPRDGVLAVVLLTSMLSLEQREKIQGLDLKCFFTFNGSGLLGLIDLLESSRMLETPRRLPSVILLSWKKEPVDCKEVHSTTRIRNATSVILICHSMQPSSIDGFAFVGC